jgi:diaminohydroxyphosphoribosylaminopyrimidine deaminase/5-amino-6-(5-phosphoribosylamino)uracil reductase
VPYAPADALLQHFYVNQSQARPFVTLKWAQDANGMMGHTQHRQLLTSARANRFVHNLRAQHAAIAIGQGTLLQDLPMLTVRHSCGHSPKRIVFWGTAGQWPNLLWEHAESESLLIADKPPKGLPNSITVIPPQDTLKLTLESLYREYQVGSILVEGGAAVLASFVQASLADEVLVIHSPRSLGGNVPAPSLPANYHLNNSINLHPDVAWLYSLDRHK